MVCAALGDPDPPAAGPQPLELPAGLQQLCGCCSRRHGWFCDGAHLGSGRVSCELRHRESTTVLRCGCGRSPRLPAVRRQPSGPGAQTVEASAVKAGPSRAIVLAADDPERNRLLLLVH